MFPGHWGRGRSSEEENSEEQGHGCGGHFRRAKHAAFWAAVDDGGGFGVRRPLRFMAYKLDLDEKQIEVLAKILDDLKTERAQAAVEERRVLAAFAEAIGADAFDAKAVKEAGAQRVKSAEQVQAAVDKALAQTHALLQPEQRQRLAYLLRTGVLTI